MRSIREIAEQLEASDREERSRLRWLIAGGIAVYIVSTIFSITIAGLILSWIGVFTG